MGEARAPSAPHTARAAEKGQGQGPCLVIEFDEVEFDGGFGEVLFEQEIDKALENERVIDSVQSDVFEFVPTGLTAPSDGPVHYVVRHQERRLQNLDTPRQYDRLLLQRRPFQT
jgi:hypothetical protein